MLPNRQVRRPGPVAEVTLAGEDLGVLTAWRRDCSPARGVRQSLPSVCPARPLCHGSPTVWKSPVSSPPVRHSAAWPPKPLARHSGSHRRPVSRRLCHGTDQRPCSRSEPRDGVPSGLRPRRPGRPARCGGRIERGSSFVQGVPPRDATTPGRVPRVSQRWGIVIRGLRPAGWAAVAGMAVLTASRVSNLSAVWLPPGGARRRARLRRCRVARRCR